MYKTGREGLRRNSALALQPLTARELMQPNPLAVPQHTIARDAVALLVGGGLCAAPVVNDSGHAIGVFGLRDLADCRRHKGLPRVQRAEFYERTNLGLCEECPAPSVEALQRTQVGQLMSQAVFSVAPETSAGQVIETMLARNVHRLLVTDDAGTLVGIIDAFQVLRRLEPCAAVS